MECIVASKYSLGKQIGKGSFGDIYLGTDITTNTTVAIKLEAVETSSQQLTYEAKAYQYVREGVGFPRIYHFGKEEKYNVLVMDLLGPSLEDLFRFCRCRFSLKTVCMLAQEMIQRIEYIHSQKLLHRDIKPDNFVIGLGNLANVVHLIDLGLCKRYETPATHEHIPHREDRSLTGTPRYASIANHLSLEQSRRDDLEALGYVFIYFMKGRLPWQGLHGETKKDKYQRILEAKLAVRVEDLCQDLPPAFMDYLDYCRGLYFSDIPDYAYLRGLFATAMEEAGLVNDGVYDWMIGLEKGEKKEEGEDCQNKGDLDIRIRIPDDCEEKEKKEREEGYDWSRIPFFCLEESSTPRLLPSLRTPNPLRVIFEKCNTWSGRID